MNDTNLMVLNYLSDVYHIKDTSVEGVEKAIDDIFNFENILPQYRSLFNSIMVEMHLRNVQVKLQRIFR